MGSRVCWGARTAYDYAVDEREEKFSNWSDLLINAETVSRLFAHEAKQ